MRDPLSSIDDEITRFFQGLGYKTSWDFSRREGVEWYEIMDDDGLICQIDMGVPLTDLVEDMKCWAAGKNGTSKSNFGVHVGGAGKRWDNLLTKVAAT